MSSLPPLFLPSQFPEVTAILASSFNPLFAFELRLCIYLAAAFSWKFTDERGVAVDIFTLQQPFDGVFGVQDSTAQHCQGCSSQTSAVETDACVIQFSLVIVPELLVTPPYQTSGKEFVIFGQFPIQADFELFPSQMIWTVRHQIVQPAHYEGIHVIRKLGERPRPLSRKGKDLMDETKVAALQEGATGL